MKAIADWLLHNGIGQNVTASALLGLPAWAWAHFRIVRPLRHHHRLVRELHGAALPSGPDPSREETSR